MSGDERRERFRHLPDPVRPEDAVESVDVAERRPIGEREDEERFLREAGAG
jgi:hypothetical protein